MQQAMSRYSVDLRPAERGSATADGRLRFETASQMVIHRWQLEEE